MEAQQSQVSKRQPRTPVPDVVKVGRSVRAFADAVDLSPAWLYRLWATDPESGPKYVKSGRRRVVLEDPREYLERVAALQQARGQQ